MSAARLRAVALLLTAGLGLSACAYDRGYGYGGLSVGYGNGYCDPYWEDCYSGYGYGYDDPWYGWYGDYYYPGIGIYVFDRWGRRHRWSDDHRRHWEGRRGHWQGRDWNDRRWERWDGFRGDHRNWRRGDRDWNREGDGWRRDRSQRRDWNENRQGVRREGMRERVEPRMRAEPRTRSEARAPRGEYRRQSIPRTAPRPAED